MNKKGKNRLLVVCVALLFVIILVVIDYFIVNNNRVVAPESDTPTNQIPDQDTPNRDSAFEAVEQGSDEVVSSDEKPTEPSATVNPDSSSTIDEGTDYQNVTNGNFEER